MAEFLLRRGADIDAIGTYLRTPISEAAERGHLDVVDLLLRGGADLTPRDFERMTALGLAPDHAETGTYRALYTPPAEGDYAVTATAKLNVADALLVVGVVVLILQWWLVGRRAKDQ